MIITIVVGILILTGSWAYLSSDDKYAALPSAFLPVFDYALADVLGALGLTVAGNIGDTTNRELDGASSIAIFESGGTTYAAVTGYLDDGVQIISLANPNRPVAVGKIVDTASRELSGAYGITTFESGGTTYAAVTGYFDAGFQIISLANPARPTALGSIDDTDSYKLLGANGITTFESGGTTYAAVTSYIDDGVQIINITDPANPVAAGSIGDNASLELDASFAITTFESDGTTYAAVAGYSDDGVQIINITDPANPVAAGSIGDNASLELAGAHSIITFESGGTTYAAVAGYSDDGVQIINITDPANPVAAGSIGDASDLELNGASSIAIFESGGTTYAAVAGYIDDGVQIINITDPANPIAAGSIGDNASLKLNGARGIATFESDGTTYVAVAATIDDGVQIIEITNATPTTLPGEAFVTVWETTSASESITIPATGTYTIDWGDGTTSVDVTGDQTHTYGDAGAYTVRISGDFTRIVLSGDSTNAQKLQSIEQWGDILWDSMGSAFHGASNVVYNATDAPDLSSVTDMYGMFYSASSFDGDISDWDTSSVTNMSHTFYRASSFDGDISDWDTSSVTDMSHTFYRASSFDGVISDWDTSSVTDMSHTFYRASSFGGDISDWDTSSVTDMSHMFEDASSFNRPLSKWDTSSVTDMSHMFEDASSFNRALSKWDVSSVTNMSNMFDGASSFNRPLSDWDVSKVTDMSNMFARTSFDGDLSEWDVSKVTDMAGMFAFANSFNRDISDWDVSSVTNMNSMFDDASSFNGDISGWNVSNVTNMSEMFYNADSFNSDLSDWDASSVTNMYRMFLRASSFNSDISDWDVSSVNNMGSMFYLANSFNQNLGNWYIVLGSTSIDYDDAPGVIGRITAQNSNLNGQNPVYRIGSGDDSDSFEISGKKLRLKTVPTKSLYDVSVTATGDFGRSNSKTVTVAVTGIPSTLPPTVDAGTNQTVVEGQTVTLNGTATDINGDPLTYSWTHDSSLTIQLANSTSPSTTFVAPAVDADTDVTFTLTVNDGTVADSLVVTVTDVPIVNSPPVADAGLDQTVQEGATVTLNGTATDDGDSLTYGWTHDSDLAITLSDPAALTATFTAPAVDADTEITFTLTVTDGPNTVTDNVIVTIENNGSPTVSAGTDQTVLEGATVTLAGTATDDGSSLTYGWTHDSDLAITLSDSAALTATFTAPAVTSDTDVTFTLTVTDGPNTVTDSVIVTIENNDTPSIDAGSDQTVQEGATVTLAGTATDDGDSLTYGWTHDSDLAISLSDAAALSTTFTAPAVDADTEVTFTLTVSDGTANSTDTVLVTVSDVPDDTDFVTTWETTTPGDSITIPARGTYAIDWGDGTVNARVRGEQTHTYADAGNHTVRISEGITAIYLNDHADAPKLRSIDQWGDAEWGSMYSSFRGASNVVLHATDAPDLSRVTDARYMFMNAHSFDGDLSGWDVSRVADMEGMFWKAGSFNGDLSGWDVSRVTDMYAMFYEAGSFGGNISAWDVSRVTNMANMFHGASSFDGDLSGWDVSSVTNMYALFTSASLFNSDLSDWDVSGVTDMVDMFRRASSFNGDLSGWDVSGATRMIAMFYHASAFDQNLGEWYVMLDDAVIDGSSVPGDVGRISAQNSFLDGQNPVYGIGSGGDSAHFKINGNALKMKSVPDGHAGPYSVTITSTGSFGSGNSRTFEISVTEGANSTSSEVPSDPRGVDGITLSSTQSGTIEVTWDAPGETPRDYRVSWAKVGENFLPRSDLAGNAFPTSPGHTVTDLEAGEEYQVKVRARYNGGGSGDWSDIVTITVMGT